MQDPQCQTMPGEPVMAAAPAQIVSYKAWRPSRMTYGQRQAIRVLAAQRAGMATDYAAAAQNMLQGIMLNAQQAQSLTQEANRIQEAFSQGDELLRSAMSRHAQELMTEHGLEGN